MRRVYASLTALVLGACSGPVSVPVRVFDAGAFNQDDAQVVGRPDAVVVIDGGGTTDAGVTPERDGGLVDSGAPTPDGGVAQDGGLVADGGFVDRDAGEGPGDTGVFDTGVQFDTGVVDAGNGGPDAGVVNAAPPPSAWTTRPIDNTIFHGQSVRFVDLDGDGDRDILASISFTDTVRLYVNGDSNGGGNGTAWNAVTVATPGTIVAMQAAVADFDQNGSLDIAAVGLFDAIGRPNGLNSPSRVAWYPSSGSVQGPWGEQTIPTNGLYGLRAIAAGDLTGDGWPEIIIGGLEWYDANGNVQGHGLRWHLNSNGTFSSPIDIEANLRGVEIIRIVDVDGDGIDDVVASARETGEMVWYENLRTGVTQTPDFVRHTMAPLPSASGFTVVQLDADPTPEMVVAYDNALGGAVVSLDAPADPRGLWAVRVIGNGIGGPNITARVSAGDLNGDGLVDVVASSYQQNIIRAFVRNSSGYTARDVRNLFQPTSIDVADVTTDGRADIVFTTYENQPTVDVVELLETVP